jgi:hypothetical protein
MTSARAAIDATLEYLADGARRIRSGDCTFVFTRLAPGRLLTSIHGFDEGIAGEQPLRLIEQEHAIFGKPVEWFIDAHDARNAEHQVFLRWTEWLSRKRDCVVNVHVLAGTRPLELTVAISRHLAGAPLILHRSEESFYSAAGCSPTLHARVVEPAVTVEIVQVSSVETRITAHEMTFHCIHASKQAMLMRIEGADTGVASDVAWLRVLQRDAPLHLFIDAWEARLVPARVQEEWRQFLVAHKGRFSRIDFLARPGILSHVMELARHGAGLTEISHVHTDADRFRRALRAAI